MKTPFFQVPLLMTFASLALSPAAVFGVSPPPVGGYANFNTAVGEDALFSLTTGVSNTAAGGQALYFNTTGNANTAVGAVALTSNTSGSSNTAIGFDALFSNTTGESNTAAGTQAMQLNTTGKENTASGYLALWSNTTGNSNLAAGVAGNVTSSARYKKQIRPMAQSSEALLSLQPVTFRYKSELDPDAIPQFGLVAEEVAKVDPDLVALDDEGKPYTVRYEAVNAMLLNEFLKEHRNVEKQGEQIAELRAMLDEQAAQLQKVNNRLEANPATPPLVSGRD